MLTIIGYFVGTFLILTSIFSTFMGVWFGAAVAAALIIAHYGSSLEEIKLAPPEFAMLKFWGGNTEIIFIEPSWIPVPKPLFGLEKFPAKQQTKEFSVEIKTPTDDQPVKFKIGATFAIDPEVGDKNNPKGFRRFIKVGGKEEVENQLEKVIDQAARQWGSTDKIGPKTWKDVYTMALGAEGVADKDDLVLNLIKSIFSGENEVEYKEKLKSGEGIKFGSLGIIIYRFTIGKPEAEIANLAKKVEEEVIEKQKETADLNTEIELAKKVVQESGGDIDYKTALEDIRRYKAIHAGKGMVVVGSSGSLGIAEAIIATQSKK